MKQVAAIGLTCELVLFACWPFAASAADASDGGVRVSRRADGSVSFLGASEKRPLTESVPFQRAEDRAASFIQTNRRLFVPGAGRPIELVTRSVVESDDLGLSQVRLRQVVAGIPVRGAEAIVQLADGGITAVSSTLANIVDSNAAAIVDAATARMTALTAVLARLGPVDVTTGEPQLEYFDPALGGSDSLSPRLSWFVEVSGLGVLQHVWIDAQTGEVRLVLNRLTEALNRRTFDMQSTSVFPNTPARIEGQGAVTVADVNSAHDLAADFYNYFLAQHGRDSYNGAGAAIESFVRFCASNQPCPYRNAFWDSLRRQIFYGQGMAVDDIVAHELTHAVIDTTADLFYSRESGALNESYADIFGETVDLTNGRGNDAANVRWQVGEEVATFFGGAIRNMSDPGVRGDPARVKDPNYYCLEGDNFGVHINSGVPNKAYALMVDGGTFNGYTVTGIGTTKAAKVQYRALTSLLGVNSNFLANFNALIQSCNDLIGTSGITHDDCSQVKRAVLAVEMSTTPCSATSTPPAPPPAAPAALGALPAQCPGGQITVPVFADDFENTASGKWSSAAASGSNHWLGGVGTPAIHVTGNPAGGTYAARAATTAAAADAFIAMASSVTIPASAWMQFDATWDLDGGFDGVVVEYSTNNGASWQDAAALLSAGRGYDAGLANGTGGALAGRVAFSGHAQGYAATRLNLSALSGASARFRFRAATDSSIGAPGFWVDNVSIYNCRDNSAGVSVTPTNGLQTGETGTTATFSVVLNGIPASNVTINLSSSDTTEGTVAPSSLVFTSTNWNVAQVVTVTGVNDTTADGSVTFSVVTAAASSSDPAYNGLNPPDVSVINADDEPASIVVTPASGLVTTEAGGVATFSVMLSTQPTSNVSVALRSSDLSEGTITTGSITFTASNWNQPVNVTITGINDALSDGDINYAIVIDPAVSTDMRYNGRNPADVMVTNRDDETVSTVQPSAPKGRVIVTAAAGLRTSEAGGAATFTVKLSLAPTVDVTIRVTSSNLAEGRVEPRQLVFTPENFGAAQTVRIVGRDDDKADGDMPFRVTLSAPLSEDPNYSSLSASDVDVVNEDDDAAGSAAVGVEWLLLALLAPVLRMRRRVQGR